MPTWIQEAIAGVSLLIFFASATLLASGDFSQIPFLSEWQVADASIR